MIETRLLARLLATARTVTALGAADPVRAAGEEGAETVRAQVAARLADGSFRVLIDGRPLKLALPAGAKPGDVIELKVVTRDGTLPGRSPDTPAADRALSTTGRLISSLLSDVPATPPRQAQPILAMPPSAPAELPEPLARAVERSGLFYESHQARWADGDYPLERLLQQPQAALPLRHAVVAGDPAPGARASLPPLQTTVPMPEGDPAQNLATTPAADSHTAEEVQTQPIAREALPLVRSQLDALDSRHIAWLGEIWPGQPLRWEIEQGDGGREPEDVEGSWNTRFSLTLPALGEIGADMAIGAGGVRLNLKSHSAATEALLRTSTPELARALAAAGIANVHLQVSRDESAA